MAWIIPVATAVIGGLSSAAGNRSQSAATRRQLKQFEQAAGKLSPRAILNAQRAFQKKFFNQLSAQMGNPIGQALSTQLSRRGLTGTGLGTALSVGAAGIPGRTAFEQSLAAAFQSRQGQANAFIGAGSVSQPVAQNPFFSGLNSGLASANVLAQSGVNLGDNIFARQPQTTDSPLFTTPLSATSGGRGFSIDPSGNFIPNG